MLPTVTSRTGSAEDLVLRSIRKKTLVASIVVTYFLISGFGVIAGALLDDNEMARPLAFGLAPFMLTGAAWFSFRARGFFGGRQSEVAQLLLEPRGDVVWIYSHELRIWAHFQRITISKSVVVGCLDGRRFFMPVPLGTGDALEKAIRECAPHACFGHSKERENRFRNDPLSLQMEGLPVGARPMQVRRANDANMPRGFLDAIWRELTSEPDEFSRWIASTSLRARMDRIPMAIRMSVFLLALVLWGYFTVTESGPYAWLLHIERMVLRRYHSVLPALLTLVVCLVAVVTPLFVVALLLPPKKR